MSAALADGHPQVIEPEIPSQLAIVVSKKVCKKAVDRNRIKRRIRHQLIPLLSALVPDCAILISANRSRPKAGKSNGRRRDSPQPNGRPLSQKQSSLLACSTEGLRQEILELLGQAHLLK